MFQLEISMEKCFQNEIVFLIFIYISLEYSIFIEIIYTGTVFSRIHPTKI